MRTNEYPKCPTCSTDLYIDPIMGFVCMQCQKKVNGIATQTGLKQSSCVGVSEYDKMFLSRCNIQAPEGW